MWYPSKKERSKITDPNGPLALGDSRMDGGEIEPAAAAAAMINVPVYKRRADPSLKTVAASFSIMQHEGKGRHTAVPKVGCRFLPPADHLFSLLNDGCRLRGPFQFLTGVVLARGRWSAGASD